MYIKILYKIGLYFEPLLLHQSLKVYKYDTLQSNSKPYFVMVEQTMGICWLQNINNNSRWGQYEYYTTNINGFTFVNSAWLAFCAYVAVMEMNY